jgi:hypothetical protein
MVKGIFFGKIQQKFHTRRKKVMSGFGVVSSFLLFGVRGGSMFVHD